MNALADQIRRLDPDLFTLIPAQSTDWDRRALLALHAATADARGSFCYLEIGSYLGGSLQAVTRDPRCTTVISIDPRRTTTPDERTGTWQYADNTTEHMLRRLASLPGVDLSKVATLEASTEDLRVEDLRCRPHYCFIDGEHTNEAVLRDARFCVEALEGGEGVVAFHDQEIVAPAITAFLREVWSDVSMALAFTGSVFAVEFGDAGILRSTVVDRAIDSVWHRALWRAASSWKRSPGPLLAAWSAMPRLDEAIAGIRSHRRLWGGSRSERHQAP
jgi:hypothetical protein